MVLLLMLENIKCRLIFVKNRSVLCASSDGVNWDINDIQIIPTEDFDVYGQVYPAQSLDGNTVWYSGFNGSTYAIGMATKTNDE